MMTDDPMNIKKLQEYSKLIGPGVGKELPPSVDTSFRVSIIRVD